DAGRRRPGPIAPRAPALSRPGMTNHWIPTHEHERAAESNRLEHAAIAVEYEARTRQVASSPELWQTWYYDHLRSALAELRVSRGADAQIRALDACGGTGKTPLFLSRHGVDVTLC